MGHDGARENTMQLVVHGVRRRVQSLGHTGQFGSQRGEDISVAPPPQGACEILVCVLKMLANQQKQTDGDNVVGTLYEGLQQQSRLKKTNELRRFIEVDSWEAVQIGDLERHTELLKVVRPNINKAFFFLSNAYVREELDELTLRSGEAGMQRAFINTNNEEDNEWRPPLVVEDWHAACQAIHNGVEQAEWANVYYKFVEMSREINAHSPGGSNMTNMLWKMSEAKEEATTSTTRHTSMINRNVVRQEQWIRHLQSPVLALSGALRRVEQW